jgi:hypothetical protein
MNLENEEIQRAASSRAKMRDSKQTTPFPSTKRPRKTAHFCAVPGTAHSPSVSEGALATRAEHVSLPSFPRKSRRAPSSGPENKKCETNPGIGWPYRISFLFSKTYNHYPYPTVEPKPLALHPQPFGPTKIAKRTQESEARKRPGQHLEAIRCILLPTGNQ